MSSFPVYVIVRIDALGRSDVLSGHIQEKDAQIEISKFQKQDRETGMLSTMRYEYYTKQILVDGYRVQHE